MNIKKILNNKLYMAILIIIGILLLLFFVGMFMNWYYKASSEKDTTIEVDTGNSHLKIFDPIMVDYSDIKPGWNDTRTFSVLNDGDDSISYSIVWKEITNSFTKLNDVKLTLTGTDNGGNVRNLVLPKTGTNMTIIDNITIGPNVIQKYTLRFDYDKNANINDNSKRVINGIISVVSLN